MGTPSFAVPAFQAIMASRHSLVGAVTRPDRPSGRGLKLHPPPVKEAALAHGVTVLQPVKIREASFARTVRALSPDVLAVVAYGRILPPDLLEAAPHGGINLHASLLPKYRGAAPVAWAIARGEKVTGITTMKMTAELDAGDILLQRTTPIGEEETAGELEARLAGIGAPFLVDTLDALERGEVAGLPQDEKEASYAPLLSKQEGAIDWGLSAAEIARRVRAFNPWPSSFTHAPRGALAVWRARESARPDAASAGAPPGAGREPGTVMSAGREGLFVACGAGSILELIEVQPQGGRRITGSQAAAGRYVEPGDRLE